MLRYQEVNILLKQSCRRHLGRVNGRMVYDTTLCTQNKDTQGICDGDAGNPLATKEDQILVGIATWSVGCGNGYPDVHTRLFPYRNWIYKNLVEDEPEVKQ